MVDHLADAQLGLIILITDIEKLLIIIRFRFERVFISSHHTPAGAWREVEISFRQITV
jgi:hypothetical protein